jgi:hypothetical protein
VLLIGTFCLGPPATLALLAVGGAVNWLGTSVSGRLQQVLAVVLARQARLHPTSRAPRAAIAVSLGVMAVVWLAHTLGLVSLSLLLRLAERQPAQAISATEPAATARPSRWARPVRSPSTSRASRIVAAG